MLRPPQKTLSDKIGNIEYFEIQIHKDNILNDRKIEIRYSKSYSLGAAILFLVLNGIVIYNYFKLPDFINQNPILSLGIVMFAMAGLITFLIQYFQNKVILKLTVDAFEYKNEKILWGDIHNMYLKTQPVEHGVDQHIVIELKNGEKKIFSLESLDQDYKIILLEVGKFYGNYNRTDSKQNVI